MLSSASESAQLTRRTHRIRSLIALLDLVIIAVDLRLIFRQRLGRRGVRTKRNMRARRHAVHWLKSASRSARKANAREIISDAWRRWSALDIRIWLCVRVRPDRPDGQTSAPLADRRTA